MQLLGSAAQTKMDFAGYHGGTFLTSTAAPSVNLAGILFALLLLGHDFFWIFCAVVGILEGGIELLPRLVDHHLPSWYVFTGSCSLSVGLLTYLSHSATMAIAFLSLSIAMDSPTFRVLTTALLLILLDYFINWGFMIWYSIKGDLLIRHEELERPNEKLA